MSAKHAMGPWRVEDGPRLHPRGRGSAGIDVMAGPKRAPICIAADVGDAANARLIAAAPEMYAALLRVWSTRGGHDHDERLSLLDEVARVLGLAEGKP
jgi:hypothetical protein